MLSKARSAPRRTGFLSSGKTAMVLWTSSPQLAISTIVSSPATLRTNSRVELWWKRRNNGASMRRPPRVKGKFGRVNLRKDD